MLLRLQPSGRAHMQVADLAIDTSSRHLGFVTSVRGAEVKLDFPAGNGRQYARATVGSFVGIRAGEDYLVGTISELAAVRPSDEAGQGSGARAGIDLLGEILDRTGSQGRFRRGVTGYPAIGDSVELLGADELRVIHSGGTRNTISIGRLHQDRSIPAYLDVDELLSKHFAVLGTTGVGKSSAITLILREVMKARPDLRIFLLDGHNEYGRCFGDRAHVVSPRTTKLPFWLFNFEEIVDVIYAGRPAVVEEVEILAELIPLAKGAYGQYKAVADRSVLRRADPKVSGFSADTPVPYLLQDLIGLIDDRMGRLDNRPLRMHYHRLITRIDGLRTDPRYAFMFQNANVGGDTMSELLTQLFRLEPDGRPMCVMQLAGIPAEVVDAVVCVLCRLAFDFGLWSEGAVPLLFICEEAHRYASADHAVGFHPTRRALSRIAKEGRKYGLHLGLVTQRPAELDPTIISQCSTLLAMRMANDRDQALLRSAVSDTAANLLSFVPSLGTGEVIGFGEGVPLSGRMKLDVLPEDLVPRSEAFGKHSEKPQADQSFVKMIVDRWRGATMGGRGKFEDVVETETEPAESAVPAPPQPAVAGGGHTPMFEQARARLLRRAPERADTPTQRF